VFPDSREDVDVSLIGVEPGKPGGAAALQGRSFRSSRSSEAIIDGKMAKQAGIQLGDKITIKSNQGSEEEYFDIQVVGITDGRQYFFQPAVFLPMEIWNKVKPGQVAGSNNPLAYNIFVVQLDDPTNIESMQNFLVDQVANIEVADRVTAYEATPGYAAQQSTLNTQRGFTLLIGILVIGGFFQIQTLQKIPNIGMLKAIGTSNRTVSSSVITQILLVTITGVFIGALVTFGLSLGLPDQVPVLFTRQSATAAIASLLVIGPIGGLVSVWMATKAEPLTAVGLSS
jgi:putative ABC transport system permease protein